LLQTALAGTAMLAFGAPAFAQSAAQPFATVGRELPRQGGRQGISEATYQRVMGNLKPDNTVFKEIRSQPEFNQSALAIHQPPRLDWRIQTGKDRLKEFAPLFGRIEKRLRCRARRDPRPVGHRVDLR